MCLRACVQLLQQPYKEVVHAEVAHRPPGEILKALGQALDAQLVPNDPALLRLTTPFVPTSRSNQGWS